MNYNIASCYQASDDFSWHTLFQTVFNIDYTLQLTYFGLSRKQRDHRENKHQPVAPGRIVLRNSTENKYAA